MRKLAPFTLIYDGGEPVGKEEPEADSKATALPAIPKPGGGLGKSAPDKSGEEGPQQTDLYKSLESIPISAELRRTLAYTCETQNPAESDPAKLTQNVAPVVKELERQDKVTTVALWDLDARVGNLPALIKPLNKSQPDITFFELQGAPVPAGLLGTSKFMGEWIEKKINRRPSGSAEKVIGEHLNSNDFYEGAEIIQQRIGVDYLVGISPFLIAGEKEDEIFWNHFSDVKGRLVLVSTHGLRESSDQAGRPIEVGIAIVVIAALALAMNRKLESYKESKTGCLIDNNVDRSNLVRTIRDLKIDDECLKLFEKRNRESFLALLESLRSYVPAKTEDVEVVDTNYWLGELDKLSEK